MIAMSLLSPPVAFAVIVLAAVLLSLALSRLSLGVRTSGKGLEPYACGEDLPTHMIQPDYGQFYPFAFFFTILHVLAMMSTTVPVETMSIFVIASVYVVGAMAGLAVLYRD